jgi:cysteinyl-tRNA synthetase
MSSNLELKLYDTLTREKRVFTPLDPERVRMYVCGPTVYDFAHIGNARPVIVFDVLFRLLRHLYGAEHVTYVRNVTDVDDKINARAAERGVSIRELTEETYRNFKADVKALGCLEPTFEPRATEYVSKPAAGVDMIRLIERLIANGNAYVAEGHVLFAVASMPDYGRLSKRSLDEMEAGARVEVAPYKRDPMDFVLWKPSPPELPGWDSPWGRGRPGWHIECSAMSAALLGETFDIHGGGIDLVFPHHENEIAQSRCAFHTPVMANFWMHNGFLQVEGEKMSKSLGNFVTIRELLNTWHGETLRFQMLMTHYRQPIDWTSKRSESAEDELFEWVAPLLYTDAETEGYLRMARKESPRPSQGLVETLLDDLNTPAAITYLRSKHKLARAGETAEKVQFLTDCQFLGLLRPNKLWVHVQGVSSSGAKFIALDNEAAVRKLRIAVANNLNELREETILELSKSGIGADIASDGAITLVPLNENARNQSAKIEALIAKRNAARKAKDFKESDRIRDELAAMGVVLKDSKDGTTWGIAR